MSKPSVEVKMFCPHCSEEVLLKIAIDRVDFTVYTKKGLEIGIGKVDIPWRPQPKT